MSGHIDHKGEAEAILVDIRAGMSADVVAAAVAGAQAHALLALVDAVREVGALLAAIETEAADDDGSQVSEGGMEVRPGDPDPTPIYPDGGFCGALHSSGAVCTWQEGHEGAHVAGNEKIVVEVWS